MSRNSVCIGIAGRAGAGKSTVAKMLASFLQSLNYTVDIIPFALPVKSLALSMGWNGKKDEKGRRLLQLLGTECGRECINENIWVDTWAKKADASKADFIIADDMRFENEINFIMRRCGAIVKVYGRKAPCNEHVSEKDLYHPAFHYIINKKYPEEQVRVLAKVICASLSRLRAKEKKMSKSDKQDKCPLHPTRNRLVLVQTNLEPKARIATPDETKFIFRVVAVGPGIPKPDGELEPPKFAIGDLVILAPQELYAYPWSGRQYWVVDPFLVMAKVEHDAVQEQGRILN